MLFHRRTLTERPRSGPWRLDFCCTAAILLFQPAVMVLGTPMAAAVQRSITSADVPEREREILMELFEKTNGPQWMNREGWGTSRPVCDWHGVQCDFVDGSLQNPIVTGLSLDMNNLRGKLPAALANLEHLHFLDVTGNHLTGAAPEPLLHRWD